MKLFAPIHSCFSVSSSVPPEVFVACGALTVKPAEDMDAHAEVAGTGGGVQGVLGQAVDAAELAHVLLRATHLYDNGAEVVADALWPDAGLVEGGPDEVGLLAVREDRQSGVLPPGLPALRGVVQEGVHGGVDPAPHVAVELPLIEEDGKGELVASGNLLDGEGPFGACAGGIGDLF